MLCSSMDRVEMHGHDGCEEIQNPKQAEWVAELSEKWHAIPRTNKSAVSRDADIATTVLNMERGDSQLLPNGCEHDL